MMSGIFVCFICRCPLSAFLQNNIAKLFLIGTVITFFRKSNDLNISHLVRSLLKLMKES